MRGVMWRNLSITIAGVSERKEVEGLIANGSNIPDVGLVFLEGYLEIEWACEDRGLLRLWGMSG